MRQGTAGETSARSLRYRAPRPAAMPTPPLAPIVRAARPEAVAQPYDFARPRVVSDRQLRAVEAAHAALADALGAALSVAAGEAVGVTVRSLDEVQAVDFERSRGEPAALFVASLGEGGPVLALDVPTPLALLLVERHLGGADPLAADGRALSDLERDVVERHSLPMVWVAMAQAWSTVPPRPVRYTADAARLVIAAPDAPVVVADLEVSVGGAQSGLSLCYPAEALSLLLGAPAPDRASAPGLDQLPLMLRAELGRTRLTVGDLLALQPGDVVPLDALPDAPAQVWVGDRFRFQARAGVASSRLALEVLTPPSPPSEP